jgi:hypothetical protein
MTFADLDSALDRAAAEFLQDVVVAIEATLAPRDQVQRHLAPSRRELAQRAGVTHSTLNDILLGRRWPRADRLLRIATAAGVTIGVL